MSHTKDIMQKKQKSSGSHHRHRSSPHSYHHNHHYSSESSRRGKNPVYDNIRNNRIKQMYKRSLFIIMVIVVIFTIVYLMTLPEESFSDFELFNKGISKQEINELKNKITEYEFYIDELEERLSKYEAVDSIRD